MSVIIPTYNRLAFLGEALESVLAQTHTNLEIIVVDDGSTDGTGDYVRGLGSDKISYVFQENQGHPGAARNVGLRMASGEFIAFLDSDDTWLPEKIETQLAVLAERPDLDLVATDFFELPAGRRKTALGLTRPMPVVLRDLLRDCPIQNSSVLIRKEAADAVGLQDETLRTCEDYEYWLRLLRRRDRSGVILARPLTVYRRHGDNIGIQDVEQCDRLSAVVARHRDYDEEYVAAVITDLQYQKAFRQALVDMQEGGTPFRSAVLRRELRLVDRLRLTKQRLLGLIRRRRPHD
ncbi:MAG: glycosyltransferase [Acidimicrobiia bacterium]|nr:glycosyltransferase [Acidimicrobiia bacterium]